MQGTSTPGEPGYKNGLHEAVSADRLREEADKMDILGIDISKRRFDVALLIGKRTRQAGFPNTEAGFKELLAWVNNHHSPSDTPIHACMEATGNWGLDLAEVLHGEGMRVSIVNPLRVKAYGQSELARNKTDKLDAALIARFCQAHQPTAWTPPATHMRELRELVRRCDNLKAARVQEINRQKSGMASPAVAASIEAHLNWLDRQIEAIMAAVQHVVAEDAVLSRNQALLLSIPGIGVVTASTLLAELPNISEFTPKGLAAFAGLSPQEHSSGTTVRRPGRISRMGSERLRRALYMCALSSKRHNPALLDFVRRMTAAGKPPKVILLAVARKLLVFAHAIVRTQKPFTLLIAKASGLEPALQ
ncbi:MAG: IS110 family transposase [Janthinobacterium lividum]